MRGSDGSSHPLRVTVGTLGAIGSLDPRLGDSTVAREVWNLQYPTLTALDPKTLAPAPGVASGWVPTKNGQGWIYTVRKGLTWSDGRARDRGRCRVLTRACARRALALRGELARRFAGTGDGRSHR